MGKSIVREGDPGGGIGQEDREQEGGGGMKRRDGSHWENSEEEFQSKDFPRWGSEGQRWWWVGDGGMGEGRGCNRFDYDFAE